MEFNIPLMESLLRNTTITRLHKAEVFGALEESGRHIGALADYIKANRPDLVDEVIESIQEIMTYPDEY